MNKLMERLNISKNDIVATAPVRAKGKETTDSDLLRQVRQQMNLIFVSHSDLVNNATYFEPIYKRVALIGKDGKPMLNKQGKPKTEIALDKDGEKVVEGYNRKSLTGQFIVEDNGDGTSTATKFNVYKDTYQIDNETLNITKVTNGSGSK